MVEENQNEMPYWPELEKITVDGEDITKLVIEMDETPLEN
jgi:hypothetical protein